MVCILFLGYYFSKFLGHFDSPQKSNDPEVVIRPEAATNMEAIENKTVFSIGLVFFTDIPSFLSIVGMPVDQWSIYRIQKKSCHM